MKLFFLSILILSITTNWAQQLTYSPYNIGSYSSGTSIALDVLGEETEPRSLLFNNDGSILYVIGSVGDDINAYPLPTAYDINSYTSGTSIALNVSAQEANPTSMLFNADGSILYVMGTNGQDINAYPLPTPYDISSYTSGTSIVLDVSTEEAFPTSMLFNNDGTILYVMGSTGDAINAYTLPTPYDISSYTTGTSIALSVAAEETGPFSMVFNNDGSILYVMGSSGKDINAYPLPTPYDISSYSLGTSIVLDVSGEETTPTSLLFNNDGTILYVLGFDGNDINAYPLGGRYEEVPANDGSVNNSTPLTITLSGETFADLGIGVLTTWQLTIGNVPAGLTAVPTITSSTLITLTFTGNASPHNDGNDVSNLTFAFENAAFTGGNAAAVTNSGSASPHSANATIDFNTQVLSYTSPYDISSFPSSANIDLNVSGQETSPNSMLFNNDGSILYVMGSSGKDINAYPLPTPYDISSYTAGTSIALTVSAEETFPTSMLFNNDGSILYVMGLINDNINAYPLPTAYDISSYTTGTSIALDVSAQETIPRSMLFNNDGTILYVMGNSGKDINAYPLDTAYSISSYTSGTSIALSVVAEETNPRDMLFSNDGSILYVLGENGRDINAYPLSTPYDISSYTSGTSIALSVVAEETDPHDMLFNNDGSILYVMGGDGEDINAYPLPTAYSISSYTPSTSVALDVSGEESQPRSLLFNNDGSILYVIGSVGDDINAYPLSTAYDINSYTSGTSIALDVSGEETSPYDMLFNNDGSILYVLGDNGRDINAYPLPTAYSISSYASGTSIVLNVSGEESQPRDMLFNNDGTILYVLGDSGIDINAYPLPTPYDISSYTSGTSIVLDVSAEEIFPTSMLFNNDGSILYVMGSWGDDINAYPLPTPYDISSYTPSTTSIALDVSVQETTPFSMLFNNDGTILYVMGRDGDDINAYPLGGRYEELVNDGSVDNSKPLTITLSGETFADLGSGVLTTGQLTIGNVPAGLTAVPTITSNRLINLTFTGNATAHTNADDVSNLTFAFDNTAFTGGNASAVTNSGSGTPYRANAIIDFRDALLPVSLISFDAETKGEEVYLNWSTASEANNAYFEVARSQGLESWETIARVDGAGNTPQLSEYQLIDPTPHKGINYYRLHQTDFDGTTTFLGIRSAEIGTAGLINVYPNPARDKVYVEAEDIENTQIVVKDLLGKPVNVPQRKEAGRVTLTTQELSSGGYVISVTRSNGSRENVKLYVN